MKVLIACEESQTVCKAFREHGHEAYSCDIQEPSGGHPEWHILGDALQAVEGGQVTTMDGKTHDIGKWDLLIAHPPCTYLTISGNSWFNIEKYGDSAKTRYKRRYEAIVFFMSFALANVDKIAVENPVGVMNTCFRKPDCIVHPYYFGDDARKKTCLWLKNLKPLLATDVITPTIVKTGKSTDSPWHAYSWGMAKDARAKARSKTFPGIAKAMAEQWGELDKEAL